MPDGDDQALLDRMATGLKGMEGFEQATPARSETLQTKTKAAWLRQQYTADPAMWRDYVQAAVRHPHLFQLNDSAAIALHVEPVVRHFAADGFTREAYFKAVAGEPTLLLQKPAVIIKNLETVMDHYAADQLMRTEYLQAAVDQPILFRHTPEQVIATVEAAVDQMEAQGVTRADCVRQAIERPRLFTKRAQAIWVRSIPANSPALPDTLATGQTAAVSPLPSTAVDKPVLCVSSVGPARGATR